MKAYEDLEVDFKSIAIKCALIYGADSDSFSSKSAQYMKSLLPDLEVTELADAQHHLFLDQPVAFIACLSKQLDAWK